jgi:hypothetical protein
MKKGDKAWVLCEVAGDSPCGALLMKGPQGTPFWANERDCKPVEQEAAEELKELDSDYRDPTEKDFNRFMRGEKVEARFRDFDYQDWNRSKGYRNRKQFLAGVELRNGKYRWVDDDNRSWMICQVYDPKKPQSEQASPIEHLRGWLEKGFWNISAMSDATVVDVLNNQPKSGLDLLCDQDIVQAGDLFDSTRDGKFHRCNFTVGMTVKDAVLRGHQQREGWTFYRPKKVQA